MALEFISVWRTCRVALEGGSSSESGVSVPTGKEKLGVDVMVCFGVGVGAGVLILIYSIDIVIKGMLNW